MRLKKIFLKCSIILSEKKTLIILFFLSIVFLLAKIFHPHIVFFLYYREHNIILNFLSGIAVSKPLAGIDFYLGTIEQFFFGPLSAVFSFLLLTSFSLKYLTRVHIKKFFLVLFLFLVITKYEILFFPPFGDDITGPFAEAVWLHQNSFDYIGLSRQPTYIHGGPKVYLFSIYPSFLALGMTLIPQPSLFLFFNHLLSLALAAGTVSFFRSFLLKFFNHRIALLLSILLLSIPVFQSQAEAINMEMPAVFFSLWAVYALSQERFLKTALLATLAIFIKMYCFFIGLTVFLVCASIFLFQKNKKGRFSIFFYGCLPLIFGITQIFLLFFFLGANRHNYAVGFFAGRHWLFKSWPLYLYMFSLIGFLNIFIKKIFLHKKNNIRFLFKKYQYTFFCFFTVAGWFAVFGQSYFFGIRYYVVMLPFFIVCLAGMSMSLLKSRFALECLSFILIILLSLFSYGMNYPERAYDQGAVRSLEYRTEVRFQKKLAQEVEARFSDFIIGAPILTAHALGIEEFGYVQKKMNVKIYFWPAKFGGIQELRKEDALLMNQIVWIAFPDKKGKFILVDPLRDFILGRVIHGEREAVLFRGGYRIFYALQKSRPLINALERQQFF